MTERTIGFSPCPNDTFIFHAMMHGLVGDPNVRWRPHLEDVEQLNRHAMEGRYEVTKLSFFAFSQCWQNYELLDSGSALGFGCGPLLITRPENRDRPIADMRIGLPGQWTTAHFLFRLAYPEAPPPGQLVFSDLEQAVLDGRLDAGVIIHENRFTYHDKGLVAIRDLGAYWEQLTGAPVPLGGIAVKRSLPLDTRLSIQAAIADSVAYAFQNPEASRSYVGLHAQEMAQEVRDQHIRLYVNDFSQSLGEHGRSAIRRFYAEATSRNLLPPAPESLFCGETTFP
ncbi:MAG: 1,4-dihydroxy-6-naphthoate synthase [Saprospiraceae bacterium]|nr:1,4-dihydroxy-6-naphthoate synthase [Saprospiraceae bacterium]